jgi:hypothetical protein
MFPALHNLAAIRTGGLLHKLIFSCIFVDEKLNLLYNNLTMLADSA